MRNKLRTYKSFKRRLTCEKYLSDISNISYRINLTKLRVSAHQLRIERGRYERVNNRMVPESDRICKYCSTNEIEDEFHFVMRCPLYQQQRKSLFKNLSLAKLSEKEIFIKLMSASDVALSSSFSKFITECFDIRKWVKP